MTHRRITSFVEDLKQRKAPLYVETDFQQCMTLLFLSDSNAKWVKDCGYFSMGEKRFSCHYLGLGETVSDKFCLKSTDQNVFDWSPVPFEDNTAQGGTIKGYVFALDTKHLPFFDLRYDNDYIRNRDEVTVSLKEQFDKDNKPFRVRCWMYFGDLDYYNNIPLKYYGKHNVTTNGKYKTYYEDVKSINVN